MLGSLMPCGWLASGSETVTGEKSKPAKQQIIRHREERAVGVQRRRPKAAVPQRTEIDTKLLQFCLERRETEE